MSLILLPGLSLPHRRCFHLAVAREMARLMQQSPKLPFVEPAFAGPEQVSIALPKLAPSLKLCLSSGTNRPSRSSRRAVLQWVAVALRSADALFCFCRQVRSSCDVQENEVLAFWSRSSSYRRAPEAPARCEEAFFVVPGLSSVRGRAASTLAPAEADCCATRARRTQPRRPGQQSRAHGQVQ